MTKSIDELIELGCTLADQGLHPAAIAAFQEAWRMGSPDARLNMGNSFWALGDNERAREAFRDAASAGVEEAWLNLAIIALEFSDWDGAEQAARMALGVGDEKAWGPLGSALWEKGDEAGAEQAFRQSLRTRESEGMLQLAFLLDKQARVAEAMEVAREAADLGNAAAIGVYAAWRWMDTHDPALEHELREGSPHAEIAHRSLIELLRETGRQDEADEDKTGTCSPAAEN